MIRAVRIVNRLVKIVDIHLFEVDGVDKCCGAGNENKQQSRTDTDDSGKAEEPP